MTVSGIPVTAQGGHTLIEPVFRDGDRSPPVVSPGCEFVSTYYLCPA